MTDPLTSVMKNSSHICYCMCDEFFVTDVITYIYLDKKSFFQLGCQPIFKLFSDSLQIWGNPDLILYHLLWSITFRVDVHFKHSVLVNSQSWFVSTIIVSLHLHMHFDINWSFSLICIVHFIIDLIFQMNSIISINLMIKSPLQYTKVQCKTRIVGVNFYFACGILYRYNCKMVLRGQSNQTYSSGFKSRFLDFIMERLKNFLEPAMFCHLAVLI